MFQSIKEERLDRLIVRKYFNKKYNTELIDFLRKNVEDKDNIVNTINYINNIEFTHPGLNSLEYIVHPLRVAKIIFQIDNNIDNNILNMSLMHNIFEVSKIKDKDFLLNYSLDTMNLLKNLTVDRSLENNLKYKKKYYETITKNRKIAIIKAIDKFDNLFLLCLNNDAKIRASYLKEIEMFIYPIVEKYIPSLFEYYKTLVDDCHKIGFLDKEKSVKLYNEDYS